METSNFEILYKKQKTNKSFDFFCFLCTAFVKDSAQCLYHICNNKVKELSSSQYAFCKCFKITDKSSIQSVFIKPSVGILCQYLQVAPRKCFFLIINTLHYSLLSIPLHVFQGSCTAQLNFSYDHFLQPCDNIHNHESHDQSGS